MNPLLTAQGQEPKTISSLDYILETVKSRATKFVANRSVAVKPCAAGETN